jgi:hypothetical protein
MLADEAALPFVEAQDNARALPQLYGSPVSYRARSLVLAANALSAGSGDRYRCWPEPATR